MRFIDTYVGIVQTCSDYFLVDSGRSWTNISISFVDYLLYGQDTSTTGKSFSGQSTALNVPRDIFPVFL